MRSLPGALVVSLDFELLWGIRDQQDAVPRNRGRLEETRRVIPHLLDLFQEFEVAATWATVGFLFARSKEELEAFSPTSKPRYRRAQLDPYGDAVGDGEAEDPLRFAPSLIDRIAGTPRQEIATHTFSHFYCGELGPSLEDFRADLEAARSIALEAGHEIRSIVFPRNQYDGDHLKVLADLGLRSYRGNPPGALWAFSDSADGRRPWRRFVRFADRYMGPSSGVVPWASVPDPNGLSNVRATCFLAPFDPAFEGLEGIRLKRVTSRIRAAARERALVHLWWHPHNFGTYPEENLRFLRSVLEELDRCRDRHGMVSMSMAEVDVTVRARGGSRVHLRSEGIP